MQDSFAHDGLPTRTLFGFGVRSRLGEEIAGLGIKQPLFLTTARQEYAVRALAEVSGYGAAVILSNVTMHTPVEVTDSAMKLVGAGGIDGLISVGGGTATGLSKAIALRTGLPQISVPTTYAGSEMTAVVGETKEGRKATIRSPAVQPRTVIYDVELTMGMPLAVSAASGLNAIAHAVEGLYSESRNPLVSTMAIEGIKAMSRGLRGIAADLHNRDARGDAFYGAWLCGTVLGSVGMALHHKLCHVLGGTFNLPHAETHAILLPHVTAFNAKTVPETLAPVAQALGAVTPGDGLYDLARDLGLPLALRQIGMPQDGLDLAAGLAVQNPYFNPRPFSRQDIFIILDDAFHGRRPGGADLADRPIIH